MIFLFYLERITVVKNLIFCGNCIESLARFDRELSALKMLQTSFDWADPQLLDHLPKSGMIVNGLLSAVDQTLEHRTTNPAGFVLPTPTANDHKNNPLTPSRHTAKHQTCLNTALGRMYLQQTNQTLEEAIGKQRPRLNPQFVTWMMGFPIDWLD